jgi:hypothetical protein
MKFRTVEELRNNIIHRLSLRVREDITINTSFYFMSPDEFLLVVGEPCKSCIVSTICIQSLEEETIDFGGYKTRIPKLVVSFCDKALEKVKVLVESSGYEFNIK